MSCFIFTISSDNNILKLFLIHTADYFNHWVKIIAFGLILYWKWRSVNTSFCCLSDSINSDGRRFTLDPYEDFTFVALTHRAHKNWTSSSRQEDLINRIAFIHHWGDAGDRITPGDLFSDIAFLKPDNKKPSSISGAAMQERRFACSTIWLAVVAQH